MCPEVTIGSVDSSRNDYRTDRFSASKPRWVIERVIGCARGGGPLPAPHPAAALGQGHVLKSPQAHLSGRWAS